MKYFANLFIAVSCWMLLCVMATGQDLVPGQTYISPAVTVDQTPDSLPSAALYVNNVLDATPVTVALKPGSTRAYYCSVTLPSSLSVDDLAEIKFDATVDSTALEPGWIMMGRVAAIGKQGGVVVGYRTSASPASNTIVVTGLDHAANAYVVFARNNAGVKEYYDFNLLSWESSVSWADAQQPMSYASSTGEFQKTYASAPFFWTETNPELKIEVRLSDGVAAQPDDPLVASAVASQTGILLDFQENFYNPDSVMARLGSPAGASITADLATIDAAVDALPTESEIIAAASGGPISQQPVPKGRTATPTRTQGGLLDKHPVDLVVSESALLCAVDFVKDLPRHTRVESIDSITITSGEASGLTIVGAGTDHSQAKLQVTPVTAGSYTVRVAVTYSDQQGGSIATVNFRVSD